MTRVTSVRRGVTHSPDIIGDSGGQGQAEIRRGRLSVTIQICRSGDRVDLELWYARVIALVGKYWYKGVYARNKDQFCPSPM